MPLINERAILIKFNVLQVSYWWSFAAMPAYIGAYLLSKGLSYTQLSLLLSAYMLLSFLGQFFWGSVCDSLQTNKKVFILGNFLVLWLNFAIFYLADHLPAIAVLYPLLGFTMAPLPSNLDTWLLKSFAHRTEVYGPARGWGSLGFALFMLFYGPLINRVGYWVMPIFSAALILITVGVALSLPDSPPPEGHRSAFRVRDIGKLMGIKPYLFLVVLLLFSGLATAPIGNMKIAILKSVGGNVSHQGYDFFFMCMFQLPFFFLAGRIRRINRKLRFVAATIGPMLMILCNYLAASPGLIIAGSAFNAISFSIMLPTMREITEENVDIRLRTTANGITDAVFQSLAGMMSLLYVGSIMDRFGMKVVFAISLAIQVIPIAMAVGSLIRKSGDTVLIPAKVE
jgi:MFS transporter, PPP family, 3-phenylpropionic acid transporter